MYRKIIHIDMDAFYASVEQRDFPELRGKPLAVGGLSDRGVIATASYEARKFGVKSAMSTVVAMRKCPSLIIVKPRFDEYRKVSESIRDIFYEYTDLVEPLSLDEAYLDVTQNFKGMQIATEIAEEIRFKIFHKTKLTASAGVSYNKFLAKIASDMNKPNGTFVISPKMATRIINELPIGRFHGIGKVTAEKMQKYGVFTGSDLRTKSQEWLKYYFGKAGAFYYKVAQGEDNRPVKSSQIRKSIGTESTFEQDLVSLKDMEEQVLHLTEKVWQWTTKREILGRTLTLKLKFNDFTQITRSKSGLGYIDTLELANNTVIELLNQGYNHTKPVRLLGVSLSNLNNSHKDFGTQLELKFTYTGKF